MNNIVNRLLSSVLLLGVAGTINVAQAVMVDLDLDDGVLNDAFPMSDYTSPTISLSIALDASSNPMDSIWINFQQFPGGAQQHLAIIDTPIPGSLDEVHVNLLGSGADDVTLGVVVTLSDVSLNGVFSPLMEIFNGQITCIVSMDCPTVSSGDLLFAMSGEEELFFHDLHVDLTYLDGMQEDTFNLTGLEFIATGDSIEIGTWPVPEPNIWMLLTIGLAGIGYQRNRTKKPA